MKIARWLIAIVVLVSLPTAGCVHGIEPPSASVSKVAATRRVPNAADRTWRVPGANRIDARPFVPPAPTETDSDGAPAVLHAAAWEEPGTAAPIVQTAGVFDKPAAAVKQGVHKVADALTPTPQVTPADDPTRLSTKSKSTPQLHLSMARYQEEQGKPAMAEQSYQQALRMSPRHLGAHLAYARFKDRQGQMREAIQLYQKAAKFYPSEAAIFNDVGLLYARHGMHAEGIAAYGRAIELQPKRALYRNNMAVLMVDSGRPDLAMKHLTAVYGEADACYKLGYLLQTKGEIHQAIGVFSRALALNPSMKEARAWLEHLRSDPAGEPRMARRPPGAGIATDLPTPHGNPNLDARRDERGMNSPLPGAHEPLQSRGGAGRQSPSVLERIPEPALKPLPDPAAEPQPGPAGPGNWPRRLPPTSGERPASHEETDDDWADRVDVVVEDAPDAPLPTPRPAARDSLAP